MSEKEDKKKKLIKSGTTLISEKTCPSEEKPQEIQNYDFLSALRRVKQVSTEITYLKYNEQVLSNKYVIPKQLLTHSIGLAKNQRKGETSLVLEIVRALKVYLQDECVLPSTETILKEELKRQFIFFEKVTKDLVDISEALGAAFSYMQSLLESLPQKVDKVKVLEWISKMIDKFILEKITEAATFIIDYVRSLLA
jgi:hypothetical protein